jgi:hypothetical protein
LEKWVSSKNKINFSSLLIVIIFSIEMDMTAVIKIQSNEYIRKVDDNKYDYI